jgi:hypothetical protein
MGERLENQSLIPGGTKLFSFNTRFNLAYRANPTSFPVDDGDVKYHTIISSIYIENNKGQYQEIQNVCNH